MICSSKEWSWVLPLNLNIHLQESNLNYFSCIFYGKHHGSGIACSFHFLCIYQCCVCPVPQAPRSHCHLEFPLSVLQHRLFCFCLTGAETGILHKKRLQIHLQAGDKEKGEGDGSSPVLLLHFLQARTLHGTFNQQSHH